MWNKDENHQDDKERAEQVVQAALDRYKQRHPQRSQREIKNDKVQ